MSEPQKFRSDDGRIEPKFRLEMNVMASFIDGTFNGEARGEDRKVGFVLLVYNFGDSSRCNYVSNSNREDVITLMKEFIARNEGRMPEVSGEKQ